MRYKIISLFVFTLLAGCSDSDEAKEIHFGPGPDGQTQDQPISSKKSGK